jgi:hypothetical protein
MTQEDVVEILLRKPAFARDYFFTRILDSVDLRLVSPFVSEGPTPDDMFFGREAEIQLIYEHVADQSFALVGGRRSGKTSILRRLEKLLGQRGPVQYIDCQAHPDRTDFLSVVQGIALGESGSVQVRPENAERILRMAAKAVFGNVQGVFLLDEVDELFAEDAGSNIHPHILSRAFRALSQSSTATLVATGERSLFQLTNDPESPHWNFCTPVHIGPLDHESASRLLREPLAALGIKAASEAVAIGVDRTARHPNLIQYLGTQMVDSLAGILTEGATIAASQVETETAKPAFASRFVDTFLSQSQILERLISTMLTSSQAVPADELRTRLMRTGVTIPPSKVLKALRFLELYSVARQQPEGYAFTSSAFDRYFAPLAKSAAVVEWIDELR